MFNKTDYEERLTSWRAFRDRLETSSSPLEEVVKFYYSSPEADLQTDPYDKNMWADPWTLVFENRYCQFNRVLGMCYSLQLTERFNTRKYEIHIGIDKQQSETYYLLFVDDKVLGYGDNIISQSDLPETLQSISVFSMPCLQ